jgi:3-oxoacyl-[acyl-carrier protein] reductase
MTLFDLTDKRALITGASGDIGRAIAETLHDCGAYVALSGTRTARLEEIASRLGKRTVVVSGDLTDPPIATRIVKKTESVLDRIDILINNAGMTRDRLLVRMSDEDWNAILDLNLNATFRVTRAAVRGMLKRQGGRIISITSIAAQSGNPGQANYTASKAALIGMTKSLAREVASRNITVNCIAPGLIESAMTQVLTNEQKERLIASIPIARMGTPKEVAAAVIFLASDQAAYITGHTLNVNGGMGML